MPSSHRETRSFGNEGHVLLSPPRVNHMKGIMTLLQNKSCQQLYRSAQPPNNGYQFMQPLYQANLIHANLSPLCQWRHYSHSSRWTASIKLMFHVSSILKYFLFFIQNEGWINLSMPNTPPKDLPSNPAQMKFTSQKKKLNKNKDNKWVTLFTYR